MFKSIFSTATVEEQVDEELEAAMRSIHARMDRMLEREQLRHIRFATTETTPSYYR